VGKVLSGCDLPLQVEEKLTVRLNKDGGMEHMEVQGNMSLQVRTPPRLQA
jgi:hypothetical protein